MPGLRRTQARMSPRARHTGPRPRRSTGRSCSAPTSSAPTLSGPGSPCDARHDLPLQQLKGFIMLKPILIALAAIAFAPAAAAAAPARTTDAATPTRFSVVVEGKGPDVILIP